MIDMVGPDEIKAWRELWAKDVSSQVAEIRRAAFQKLVMCDLALDGIKYRQRLIPEEAQLVEALDNLQACAGTIYGQYGDRFKNSLAMDLHHAIEKAQALVRERVPQPQAGSK